MAKTASAKKTAVVFIHGIGNQLPLQTLRGFVDAVWWSVPDTGSHLDRRIWVKPETVTGDYELRRITTSRGNDGTRFDFYEFYWAHLMEGTRLVSVLWWLKRLFVRRPSAVPETASAQWWAIGAGFVALFSALLFIAGCLLTALRVLPTSFLEAVIFVALAGAVTIGLWFLRYRVLIQVVGDAARYLTPDPENISARSRIRRAGISLLQKLNNDPSYDRIIVVGHSLGTVVGYDILNYAWSDCVKEIAKNNSDSRNALRPLEQAAEALRKEELSTASIEKYRATQFAYAQSLQGNQGQGWKVTDFVTMGSPLTYASFLLVDDQTALSGSEDERYKLSWIKRWHGQLPPRHREVATVFGSRIAERSFACTPPMTETEGNPSLCYVSHDLGKPQELPHHATVFAPVRWTNLYAPAKNLLWGDVISGPLAPLFGPGVVDIELKGAMASSFVAHVHYWNDKDFAPGDSHLTALRQALALGNPPPATGGRP